MEQIIFKEKDLPTSTIPPKMELIISFLIFRDQFSHHKGLLIIHGIIKQKEEFRWVIMLTFGL